MSWSELGRMSLRQYVTMWNALKLREKRQQMTQGLLVEQMGHLVAMVANTSSRPLWDDWRHPEEFMPVGWSERHAEPEEFSEDDFDAKMRRVMEKAVAYQAGQVER